MKNIRLVLIGELLLFIAVFMMTVLGGSWGMSAVLWFLDLPSILLIVLIFVPGLLIMGEWKNFLKAFSVGIRPYSLLELKMEIDMRVRNVSNCATW